MTAKELGLKEDEIQNEIKALAKRHNLTTENLLPIYDGIYSAEKYLSAPLRLMWVLKEPYDDADENGNPCGGGWSISKDLFKNPADYASGGFSAKMVTRLSYCLLNGKKFAESQDLNGNPEIAAVLQNIAYINISKMPAGTTTNDATLPDKYNVWKTILLKQIELYFPDIIIFGNTFNYFASDLFDGNSAKTNFKFGMAKGYRWNKSLLISAYHPGFPKNEETQDNYASEIIKIVNTWKSQNK